MSLPRVFEGSWAESRLDQERCLGRRAEAGLALQGAVHHSGEVVWGIGGPSSTSQDLWVPSGSQCSRPRSKGALWLEALGALLRMRRDGGRSLGVSHAQETGGLRVAPGSPPWP